MKITIERILTKEHAEALRVLRNECAEWMTRDTAQITPDQQAVFFREKIAGGLVEGFLMLDGAEPVAYGVLVPDDEGRVWSSTGVKASRRGQGLGRAATIENIKRAHARGVPIWAEVRTDNVGQQRICRTVGYRVIESAVVGEVPVDVMRCDELARAYA